MRIAYMSVKTLMALFLLSLVILFVYYPGLYGDYVFDDSANILSNKKLAVDEISLESLNSAAYSGEAGPLGRPLSMLSFALNYYFTGFDPFYFKLTNLLIHISNTLLVFFISRQVFSAIRPDCSSGFKTGAALAVAMLWGLHPLNLTSVLYVVQRMVSLSALFGFLALYAYGHLRTVPHPIGYAGIALRLAFVAALIVASALSKESGLLFIPLIILLEFFVFRGAYQGKPLRLGRFKFLHILIAGVALAGILVLIQLPEYMNPAAFLHRDFNLVERLLTEARVLFYYLKLFVFPRITELSLYHDNFVISRSLMEPITTLYSIVGLFIVSLACLALVKKEPMLLFGWCWFLVGHAMESTFISLELVHEHRNYFAIVGLLLPLPLLYLRLNNRLKKILLLVLCVYTVYLGFSTWQRATIWNNLVDHAAFEASQKLDSDRANYQLARIYMKLMEANKDNAEQELKFAKLADDYLALARQSYNPSNGAWFAHLHLSYYLDKEPDMQLIDELQQRLNSLPFYNNNIGYLSAFANCQIERYCKLPHHQAVGIFAAAAENPTINASAKAEVLKLGARYFAEVAGDYIKAEEFLLDALRYKNDVNGHLLLTQVYRGSGNAEKAQQQLDMAKKVDSKNAWYREVLHEQEMINKLIQHDTNQKK